MSFLTWRSAPAIYIESLGEAIEMIRLRYPDAILRDVGQILDGRRVVTAFIDGRAADAARHPGDMTGVVAWVSIGKG